MNLTSNPHRLMMHAYFERVCELPESRRSIRIMCEHILDVNPNFFSDNEGFEEQYDDSSYDYTEFDLALVMLKQVHFATLFEDNTAGYHAALSKFNVPECRNEEVWGDTVSELLDAISSYVNFDIRTNYVMDGYSCGAIEPSNQHQYFH